MKILLLKSFLFFTLIPFGFQAVADSCEEAYKPLAERLTPKLPASVALKGSAIYRQTWGDPSKQPMVLVHGLLSSHKTWQKTAEDLSRDYFVIAYDQRGHGATPFLGVTLDSVTMAKDLKHLLDDMGEHRKVLLVGHSMGGRTVTRFAQLYPQHVLGVVVEDMHMKGLQKYRDRVNTALWRVETLRKIIADKKNYKTQEEFLNHIKQYEPDAELAKSYMIHLHLNKESNEYQFANDADLLELYSSQGLGEDLTDALKGAPAPFLFLRADESKKPALFGEGVNHIQQHRPDVKVVLIPGAEHTIHKDGTLDDYLKTLREFFKSIGK